ncbi:outer membrane beta-barrel protein [Sphingobium yanoikuyae]|uniref:Outer membrane beta-barrel protein n=2 Tax=Sphingobium TaxID=165695 RepID=A0A0J9D321_SPHYA|nr:MULTISPECIES: outer membrane beta-barrel protein [Sphingobium]ATP18181.1 hypothetical protein BV87_07125 [Sphingobium yanoikuyae]KMW31554.1 membrane protein [Sphingobium yanoikuyae]MBB4146566.1 outer membrane immunogenic protein [Sphingobium scionense]MDH2129964.1 outer membrane beta-barrel protein [Sphingobium yanoikuyae]MDH2147958.1 outer membrane beta-barrel protein [Sphingobium yanoikuyae]
MKNVLFAAAALAAVSAPAYAQEASNFGGFKVGATVGYDSVNLSYDDLDDSKGGFLYGLTAGYDYDIGTLVIGVEGEVSDSTVKETATDVLVDGDRWKLSAGRDLYVGARLGFPVSQNLMLYAKGGYTNARAKLSVSYDGDSASEGDNLDGYRVGGGIEFANAGNFARLEYRYSDYGNYSYDGFNTGIAASRHQIAVTGGFRF